MNSNRTSGKDKDILRNLKSHLASLPDKKPSRMLPQCHCMKLFRPLLEKRMISGTKLCICCSSLLGWRKSKSKDCPFEE